MSEGSSIPAVDQRLLETLEASFARIAGPAGVIDADALQRALGLRSAYLARRVLARFDRDGDGRIDREEFLAGVRALVFGGERERLAFAFQLHDHDGDGYLGAGDVHRMVAMSLADGALEGRVSQPPDGLAAAVMRAADADGDGRISFDEFVAAVRARPALLRAMTRAEALWIAPSEDLLARLSGPLPFSERALRFARYVQNRLVPAAVFLLWGVGNAVFLGHELDPGVRGAAPDLAVRLARATGLAIQFNAALVLVPVLRRLLTKVRASPLGRVVPVDQAIDFHRVVGHWLMALTAVHVASIVGAFAEGHPGRSLADFLLGTRRGATGTALLGVFGVMWLLALGPVRRSRHFELFYFSHLLYMLWFALGFAHAPSLLRWVALPLVGFAFEQLLRVRRSGKPTVAVARALRSGVTRLDLARPEGFSFSPGDYVFLRIPAVAEHEWHPFTVSSAPEQPEVSVHVRVLGDWTSALRRLVEAREAAGAREPLAVHVDGPYGSPTAHLFRSKHAVFVGAGIGVTPFASVLESFLLRARRGDAAAVRRVHFVWLNRDHFAFEWFVELLEALERDDARGLLDLHLYMTDGRAGATAFGLELAREIAREEGRRDLVTGLRARTHMGHPDWDALLGAIAKEHAPDTVDVFFCGPPGLAVKVRAACARAGMTFRREVF